MARRCGEVGEAGSRGPLPNPADSVPKICERLGLGHTAARRAVEVAEEAREMGLVNMKKSETIAAAVYLAALPCGEPRPQRHVAEAAGASEVSLRKASRDLAERLGLPSIGRR